MECNYCKHTYSSTVLKYIFKVLVLHISEYFYYFLFPTFGMQIFNFRLHTVIVAAI